MQNIPLNNLLVNNVSTIFTYSLQHLIGIFNIITIMNISSTWYYKDMDTFLWKR